MKSLTMALLLAAVCLCAAGCEDQQALNELARLQAAEASLEANKALVRRAHAEVWNSGNLAAVDEIYSADYVAHWAYGEDSDREGIKRMVAEARGAFPDMRENVVHLVAEGDLVVSHFVSSGTFTGELNGLTPTGKELSRPEIAVYRITNGMIAEQWTVSDQLSVMQQLGLM